MPLITEEIVSQLGAGSNQTDNSNWSDFGFLYGTFPTAPSVFVYATKYNLECEVIGESYESFDHKRALVKYQSRSEVIKVMLYFHS